MFNVIVENIGNVAEGEKFLDVYQTYLEYVSQSQDNIGRAAGENVTLTKDGEPVREYWGTLHEHDCVVDCVD